MIEFKINPACPEAKMAMDLIQAAERNPGEAELLDKAANMIVTLTLDLAEQAGHVIELVDMMKRAGMFDGGGKKV